MQLVAARISLSERNSPYEFFKRVFTYALHLALLPHTVELRLNMRFLGVSLISLVSSVRSSVESNVPTPRVDNATYLYSMTV